MAANDLIPAAVGAAIESAFIYSYKEALAPFAGLAGDAVARYLTKRLDAGKHILRSALERAGATAQDFRDADQFAAAALRYVRAARDQAADANLRILAQALVGLARRHTIWASDFLKYAEIIAPLIRDELLLIGSLMAEDREFYTTPRPPNSGSRVWQALGDKLVSENAFPSIEHIMAVAAQAQRSGLLVPLATFGGTAYELSPIGRALRDVVDIKWAIRDQDDAST